MPMPRFAAQVCSLPLIFFGPVVHAHAHRLSERFNDLLKHVNDTGCRQGEVYFDTKAFAVKVLEDI